MNSIRINHHYINRNRSLSLAQLQCMGSQRDVVEEKPSIMSMMPSVLSQEMVSNGGL